MTLKEKVRALIPEVSGGHEMEDGQTAWGWLFGLSVWRNDVSEWNRRQGEQDTMILTVGVASFALTWTWEVSPDRRPLQSGLTADEWIRAIEIREQVDEMHSRFTAEGRVNVHHVVTEANLRQVAGLPNQIMALDGLKYRSTDPEIVSPS